MAVSISQTAARRGFRFSATFLAFGFAFGSLTAFSLVSAPASALPLEPWTFALVMVGSQDRPTAGPGGQPIASFGERLLVTATTHPEKLAESPFAAEALDRGDLLTRKMVRTVPEALEEQPGVMVQKTSHGQGSPYLRGFTGFRTLFLIDDVRLNNAVFRDGPNQYWATVDAQALEHLEVVRGPSAALYGSDSVGGTVQALTVSPSFAGWQGSLYGRWASAEHSSVGRTDLEGQMGSSLGFRLGLSRKSFGDLEGGAEVGQQPHTGYDQGSEDLKLIWQGKSRRLTLLGQHDLTDDAWRTHSTIFGNTWRGVRRGTDLERSFDQTRTLFYLRLDEDQATPFYDRLVATTSWQLQEEDLRRIRGNGRQDLDHFDVATLAGMLRAEKSWQRALLTWGLESSTDQVDSSRRLFDAAGRLTSVGIQGPVADDAEYQLSGAYGQLQLPLGHRSRLLFGLRYTYAAADAERVEDPITRRAIQLDDSWDAWTSHLRFVQSFGKSEAGQLWLAVSQAFRAPNLSDLTRYDTARSGEIETPTLGLDPEQYVQWELGLRWQERRFQAEIVLFDLEIDGLIDRTPTGRVIDGAREVTKFNSGNGYSRGFDLSFRAKPTERLSAFATYSFLRTEISTYPTATSPLTREPLNREMPPTATLGLRYDFDRHGLFLEAVAQHADAADRLSSGDRLDRERIPPGGTPAYTFGTLRTGFTWHQLQLALALENLTNEDYRIHGSGLNESGRNLVASAFWRF